jgi:carboxypeptidase C (cathepsin A)
LNLQILADLSCREDLIWTGDGRGENISYGALAMTVKSLVIWLLIGAFGLSANVATGSRAWGQEAPQAATPPAITAAQGEKPPEAEAALPQDAVTAHRLTLAGRTIDYTARAGSLSLADDKGVETAEIFYVAFLRGGDATTQRPITIALNGGPGAASAYLDFLATGPRILDLGDGRRLPPAHGNVVDNPDAWLDFTDLVFIDPIGTGYSIAKGGADAQKYFFGVRADLDALSTAIGVALDKLGRRDSPIYLLGESYGGFRAARLPLPLSEGQHIAVSGTILLSPVIEFSLMQGDAFNPLPAALHLPSYAAVNLEKHGALTPEALINAERFARGDYLTALAAPLGDTARRKRAYATAAKLMGIPEAVVEHWQGRVPVREFAREIDRAEGGMAAPYDGSVVAPVADPPRRGANRGDPILAGLTAPVTEGFVRYLRDELQFKTDRAYVLLNGKAARQWNWDDDGPSNAPGAAEALQKALQRDPKLRVIVAGGMTDLVAPYFMNAYVIDHLPQAARDRITLRLYAGGHMMYLRPGSRAALQRDARALYRVP